MNESRTDSAVSAGPIGGHGERGFAVGRPNRPTDFVAAALPDTAAYERAVAAIADVGIAPSELAVLQGEIGADTIADGRRRSRSWFDLADEERYVESFERAARAGAWVIGVALPDDRPEMRARVRSILLANGGYSVVSRSRWTHDVER